MIELASIPILTDDQLDTIKTDFLAKDKPVILPDFAKNWRALEEWTPEFFIQRYGHLNAPLFNETFQQPGKYYLKSYGKMLFADYLKLILSKPTTERLFLFKLLQEAPELLPDINLPERYGKFSKNFIFLFFGGEGALPPNHYDVDLPNVFHTVLYGEKKIILFPPSQSQYLYQHPFTVRTYVNVEEPNYSRFPKLKYAKGFQCILKPGQTLFIPSGYWHNILYLTPSYAISLRQYKKRWKRIPLGLRNMYFNETIDKLCNKFFSDKWFDWKCHHAK